MGGTAVAPYRRGRSSLRHPLAVACLASLLGALACGTTSAATMPTPATASTPRTARAPPAAPATTFPSPLPPPSPSPAAHLTLVLAIDTSGSMRQSDPAGARAAAARQIAAGLAPGDHLGMVGFADAAVVLLPLEAMGTPQALAAADAAIATVGASGATDIQGAVRVGSTLLAADPSPADWHVLVLLTDGVADLPSLAAPAAAAAYHQQTDAAAAALAQRGWVLYTVGLGSGVDGASLAALAKAGGGRYVLATSADTLARQLLTLFAGVQRQAQTQAPPPPAPTHRLALLAVPVARRGAPTTLGLRSTNTATTAQTVTLLPHGLPAGWSLPAAITVPPGQATIEIPLHAAARPGGTVDIVVTVPPPAGVALTGAVLSWQVRPLSVWRTWPAAHRGWIAAGVAALLVLVLLTGFAGYVCRVLPRTRPGGSFEVVGSQREPLGRVVIPLRSSVAVGGAGAPRGTLPLPWIPGGETLFRVRAGVEGSGGLWRMGMAAWRRAPQTTVRVEAEWPYHLYPGAVPQRRVDLYDHTTFGAAGLTFTFHTRNRHAGTQVAGTDLLQGIASPGVDGGEGADAPPGDAAQAVVTKQPGAGQTGPADAGWTGAAGDPGAA